jgi:iron complex transport system ATP-binding protein
MTTLLNVQNLNYTVNSTLLIQNIAFSIQQGEIIGLLGANGAGKSTLLKCLCGILTPPNVHIELLEKSIHHYSLQEKAKIITYIAQQTHLAWQLTVADTVALGRIPHGASPHNLSKKDQIIRNIALDTCKLNDFKDRIVDTLSGGEKARVWLARALATQAPILLADEPLAGLDPKYQLIFMDILKSLKAQNSSIIITLHDISMAMRYCDKLLILKEGQILGFDTPTNLANTNIFNKAFDVEFTNIVVNHSLYAYVCMN